MTDKPPVRNLHLEGFRYYQPAFIAMLNNLGVPVDPGTDRQAIRRFLMGELMTPIPDPVRQNVRRTACLPACEEGTTSLDALYAIEQSHITRELAEIGFDAATLNIVEVSRYHHLGVNEIAIDYMDPETDTELAKRRRHAITFNALLAIKDKIYARIDTGGGVAWDS